jgi:hypothetical protein
MLDLVVRADATPKTGAGHVMRCAILAETWRASRLGKVTFAGDISIDFVLTRVADVGAGVASSMPRLQRPSIVLCDSYDEAVRTSVANLDEALAKGLVDDIGFATVEDRFDVVWNPNAYDAKRLYPALRGRILDGTAHVPIRGDLPRWRGPSARGVAALLGGGENAMRFGAVMTRLEACLPDTTFAGVGSWLPAGWRPLPRSNPWSQIVRHDSVIVAAGATTWEAAAVGIPVVLARTADNQNLVIEWGRQHDVPVVDLLDDGATAEMIAARLAAALKQARPLPAMEDGSPRVRDVLTELANRSRPAA